jgi:serine/threonine protein kinase
MGTVFLAEQIALGNRPVALKILLRKLLDNPEFLQRFHNEAASTARIRHPNVITVHELGQSDDGSPYIAMEYLEGETLGQALQRRGALPVAEVIEIVRQIARGLNAAHKLDIIHRDLKPDNIFLAKTEDASECTVLPGVMVKIMDFGRSFRYLLAGRGGLRDVDRSRALLFRHAARLRAKTRAGRTAAVQGRGAQLVHKHRNRARGHEGTPEKAGGTPAVGIGVRP